MLKQGQKKGKVLYFHRKEKSNPKTQKDHLLKRKEEG